MKVKLIKNNINMKFTTKQLFSITDGRLSTNMDDVYEILNTVVGGELMTHQLPVVKKYIEETKPKWYKKASKKLRKVKEIVGNDFNDLMKYFDKKLSNETIEVTEITSEEKKHIGKYLADNSLLFKN